MVINLTRWLPKSDHGTVLIYFGILTLANVATVVNCQGIFITLAPNSRE
jgi:hypothetical protein